MSNGNPESLHGLVGNGLGGFSRLLAADPLQPSEDVLKKLADVGSMGDPPDTLKDEPDTEENLYVPAGYTYFGQFVDHDITFDTTSSFSTGDNTSFTNQRTPSFDLDNVYGSGPDAAPYMYQDGIKLVEGIKDLPRSAPGKDHPGRAIIGDPRNDENSIVCNLQMAFIKFHNAVVDKLLAKNPALKGTKELFNKARNEVRWTYQHILVEDFLPRIICHKTLKAFEIQRDPNPMGLSRNESAYRLFTPDKRSAMPLEFAGAAYRFGHSMVRTGYRLNADFQALIFAKLEDKTQPDESLVGFQPLPAKQVIGDWSIFLPDPNGNSKSKTPGHKDDKNNVGSITPDKKRLQFAYRIDTTFVNPLAFLPPAVVGDSEKNLGARNLLRGRKFLLPCGQAVASALCIPPLDSKYLVCREKKPSDPKQTYKKIPAELFEKTPLWFYILAEAQMPMVDWWLQNGAKPFDETDLLANASQTATQLRGVGAHIVLEVFHGLLDTDPNSYRNHPDAANWQPLVKECRLWNIVNQEFA